MASSPQRFPRAAKFVAKGDAVYRLPDSEIVLQTLNFARFRDAQEAQQTRVQFLFARE